MSRPRSHHPARLAGACPCGLTATYDDCCGRLHRGQAWAATPEQLMRSRFTAYAVHDEPYLLRTWQPATAVHVVSAAAIDNSGRRDGSVSVIAG